MEELDLRGSQPQSLQQQVQHVGSGGRSRKRSLSQEMSAASKHPATQHSCGQQTQQQEHCQQVTESDSGVAAKQSRTDGSCFVGTGKGIEGACANSSSRLPGIAEESGEGQDMQQ